MGFDRADFCDDFVDPGHVELVLPNLGYSLVYFAEITFARKTYLIMSLGGKYKGFLAALACTDRLEASG